MSESDFAAWREGGDADFAHEIADVGRFRCNAARDRVGPMGVFRMIPTAIRTADDLGLTREVQALCQLTKGLVLVTGPTGSGKSTTLAALVDVVNATRSDHILTIEDPIEFVHQSQRCVITQRQVGVHTKSFKSALRAALREDPDVILVGELRDLETVSIALETAETGHLVFGTLHTTTAASTVDRIIDQFPTDRQSQIRVMLAESFRGVVAQTLCKKIGGGRVAAYEILLANHAVSNLIREGKTFQIPSIMQTNRRQGMVTLNDALLDLVERKLVEPREAFLKAVDKPSLLAALKVKGHPTDFTGEGVTAPPILVLVEPQDLVNIASAIRIAKNFGIELVRLVKPRVFDPYRIEGIAHNTGDIVDRIRMCQSVEEAIGDCTFAVALTARERAAKRQLLRPPAAAAEVTERSAEGPVALVFGREDSGLTNDELDRCHALATIATNPAHRSLNLAQAVAIMGYECWNAREEVDPARKAPRRRTVKARADDLASLFQDSERALWAIDFFKSRNGENVLRSIREIVFRADLDEREAKLLRAMTLETVHFLSRNGVLQELPERLRLPAGQRPAPDLEVLEGNS